MKVEAVISLKAEHRLDALLQAAGLARSKIGRAHV